MSKSAIVLVTGLMGIAAFAGCVTEDAGTNDTGGTAGEDPRVAEFDANTGAIQGTVQSSELLPIEGAQVGILPDGPMEFTNVEGAFALSSLEPGQYEVAVNALGYESKGQKATVNAGELTTLNFILDAVTTATGFPVFDVRKVSIQAVMWKLTPECIYTDEPLVKTCGGVRLDCEPNDGCEVHYESEFEDAQEDGFEWKTIVGEVAWEQQSGATGRGFSFDINAPNIQRSGGGSINQADPMTFSVDSDQSPIIIRIDNPATLTERGIAPENWCCDWFYRLFAAACDLGICNDGFGPDYGIAIDNVATIYMSLFFGEPAEPGWSALPDA